MKNCDKLTKEKKVKPILYTASLSVRMGIWAVELPSAWIEIFSVTGKRTVKMDLTKTHVVSRNKVVPGLLLTCSFF